MLSPLRKKITTGGGFSFQTSLLTLVTSDMKLLRILAHLAN